MDKLYAEILAALTALGLTEIEAEFKPKRDGVVKLFVSAETPKPQTK